MKDITYYEDLLYFVKKTANLDYTYNEETEKRIEERLKGIKDNESNDTIKGEKLSEFEQDIFEIVRKVSKKSGESFKSISWIRLYPEIINEVICEIENNIFNCSQMSLDNIIKM